MDRSNLHNFKLYYRSSKCNQANSGTGFMEAASGRALQYGISNFCTMKFSCFGHSDEFYFYTASVRKRDRIGVKCLGKYFTRSAKYVADMYAHFA